MSAFLGPIHHIMFQRIRLVGERQDELAAAVTTRMSPGQREELERAWSLVHHPAEGELGELIGDAPIHAWLQREMEATLLSEAQLWALAGDRPERRAAVLAAIRDHGRDTGEALRDADPGAVHDARRLLQLIDRVLLASMPCDRVADVVAAAEGSFIVRRDLLFHQDLWRRAGLSEELALAGHEAWLQGLVSAFPGRLVRAEVVSGGRRLFDDRFLLHAREEAVHGS